MAPVVLIEFSDYECPFCSRHATTVFPELREDWIEGGDLAVVFVNNPLGIHPNARTLAAGAICGGELGDYWAWHERIFVDAIRSTDGLLTLADYFGIERRAFEECMSDELTAETIERDIDEAERLGFTATPSFALGRRRTNNRNVVEVEKYIFGAQPYSIFADAMSLLIQAEGGQLVGNAIPN
jgi:protein-disulfide isomerase